MAAADAAVILRAPDLVNRVSCPVKVGEYLAAGLPLVISPGIGDLSDLVDHHGLGVVAGGAADASRVAGFLHGANLAAVGNRCRDFAAGYLLWQNYRNQLERLFR